MSIRWRLTLFHAATILIIAGVLVALGVVAAYRGVTTSVEETARARAQEAARLIETGDPLNAATLARLTADEVYLLVRDAAGNVVRQTPNDPPEEGRTDEDVWRRALATEQPADGSAGEVYVLAIPVEATGELAGQAAVIEARKSYDDVGEAIFPFARAFPFVLPVVLAIAIAGSYLVARSALAPVAAITRTARQIPASDLSGRLPVVNPHDELGQLALTINDLIARIEIAFAEREETLARQRRFVADASHELRTPLTAIAGYARMLRQWGLTDPAVARESVEALEREAARMDDLVEGLLALARGDEGVLLDLAVHDLRTIASEAVAAARVTAKGEVGLIYKPPDQPVLAALDPDRIRQVATILLDNAIKYTPRGGTITVAVRSVGRIAELEVADTGIGIAPGHLPHVFDRFYRIDEARTAGGSGLGLAIARQIVEAHSGEIVVASEPGRGSTFTVRLPTAPADRHPRPDCGTVDPAPGRETDGPR